MPNIQYIDIDSLVGTREVAEAMGVSRQAVSNWKAGRSSHGFPEPLVTLAATPVWEAHLVDAWALSEGKGAPRWKTR